MAKIFLFKYLLISSNQLGAKVLELLVICHSVLDGTSKNKISFTLFFFCGLQIVITTLLAI